MTNLELQQLELFAQVDELLRRLNQWAAGESVWQPLNRSRALLRRLLPRLESLRVRLEAPLVIATFGGTGTGKSSLVNALVGQECSRSGHERPTTRRPVLLAHPQAPLASLGLPIEQFDVVSVDAAVLRDIVIIDCPDPDTNEAATSGSNLDTLRRLLPHCDVLIYTSTQQKYRSSRVIEELDVAATGCRLLFVQTHAEHDVDIRDDWRTQLAGRFDVPEMFFVDSVRALREQQAGQRPVGDFARLQDFLSSRMAATERLQIRRANLLDLTDAALTRCRELCDHSTPAIAGLQQGLMEHRQRLAAAMSNTLREQLEASRHLWEQRLLTAVTSHWGVSPFSSALRLYNGLGALLTTASLARARTTAQIVLIGAMQGTKWLTERHKDRAAENRFEELVTLGVDDSLVQEARVVLGGHLHDAQLDAEVLDHPDAPLVREDAARMEQDFLKRSRDRIEAIIAKLAKRNSGFFARCLYELLFGAFIAYVLYRAGRAFFYDSMLDTRLLLPTDFYISAAIFFGLWTALLIMSFSHRLRRGLHSEIIKLASELAEERLTGGLFPQLEATLADIQTQRGRLDQLATTCEQMRRELATTPGLGAPTKRTAS